MILCLGDLSPKLEEGVFVAESALVAGDVTLGHDVNIWFGSVVRGDVHRIVIGARTNIQDLSVVHVTAGTHPAEIGQDVTVGHRAIVHGCRIEDGCLIGMGAVVLDGAVVKEGAMVAAGAVVVPGTVIPAGMLAMGIPARPVRPVSPDERQATLETAQRYIALARRYQKESRRM